MHWIICWSIDLPLLEKVPAGTLLLVLGKTALQLWCTDSATAVATVEAAHIYLTVRALGAPLNSCLLVLQASCRGMGNAGLSLRAAVVANIVNLVLDPLLIFGLRFGVRGAALATVTGQVLLFPLRTRQHTLYMYTQENIPDLQCLD